MPALVLLADGKETRYALEGRPFTVGRSTECDLQVSEERASRRHFTVEPTERGWVLRDLDSSNGTALNGYGISQALLTPGDVIELGGMEFRFDGDGAAPPPRAPRAPRKAPSPAPVWSAAAVLLVVTAVATDILAVEAARDVDREIRDALVRASHAEFLLASRQRDPAEGERMLGAWLSAHAASPDAAAARARLDEVRATRETREAAAADAEHLRASAPSLHPAEFRWRLESLVRRWSDSPAALAVTRASIAAAPRPGAPWDVGRALFQRRKAEADAAAAAGNYGAALDLWSAHAAGLSETDASLDDVRSEARRMDEASVAAAAAALGRAYSLRDAGKPDEGMALLRGALPPLAGTGGGRRVAARVAAGMGLPSLGRDAARRTPEAEGAGYEGQRKLHLRARDVEQFVALRDYRGAQQEYAALAADAAPWPAVKAEMEERALWLGRTADLLDAVRALPGGWKGKPWPATWEAVPPADLHPFLVRAVKAPTDRLAVASFAFDHGLKKESVEAVCRALDDPALHDEAEKLYSRRAGIPVPEGGFVADRGEVVSRGEWNRRRNAEAIAKLREREGVLARKLLETPVARSIAKIATLRAELDRRRAHALELIFDEITYFYPYQDRMGEYTPVQQEVDRRVAAVREIWDDRAKVRTKADSGAAAILKEFDESAAKLKSLGAEPTPEEGEVARFRKYLDADLDVRSYFLGDEEQAAFAWNAGVMKENGSKKTVAEESEKEQVSITNEYRVMFGRRALLIADKLVLSARAHGDDMSKGGFFNHFNVRLQQVKPGEKIPVQACGCSSEALVPGCSHGPDARMRRQGYEFIACSENIHAGSGDPEGAHRGWIHSSGHHRNILASEWKEMGTGRVGKYWTQNFGLPLTYEDGAPSDGAGSSPWDRSGGRGTGGDGNPPPDDGGGR